MTYEEMRKAIEQLAKSQGFYGRLLEGIIEIEKNDPNNLIVLKDIAKQFNDVVDMVMYFEG